MSRQNTWHRVLGLILAAAVGRVPAVVDAGTAPAVPLSSPPVTAVDSAGTVGAQQSFSGRFVVVGSDEQGNRLVACWVDELARKLEQTLDVPLSFRNRSFEIRVLPEGTTGGVSIAQTVSSGRLIQKLEMPGWTKEGLRQASTPLCRLLLNGYAIDLRRRASAVKGQPPSPGASLPQVPGWFAEGVTQNLHPALRAWNSDQAVQRWRAGSLPSLKAFLDSSPGKPVDPVMAGVLVSWILSLPGKENHLGSIFRLAAEGQPVGVEWIRSLLDGESSAGDLDEAWDQWILHQKRMVYDPGTLTPGMLAQIRNECQLVPGSGGVPLSADLARQIGFKELIRLRHEPWAPTAARSKAAGLKVLATGRGRAIQDAVELYARFLEAVADRRKSEAALRRLLKRADVAMQKIEDAAVPGKALPLIEETPEGISPEEQ